MDRFSCYLYYSNRLENPAASKRCPYCKKTLPGCDCGYGLMDMEPAPSAIANGIKTVASRLYAMAKKLFTVKRRRLVLHS